MHTMQEAVRQRITALMNDHNYSISELARRANLSQSTVNDIVKAKLKTHQCKQYFKLLKHLV